MKIGLGCDHAGWQMKEDLIAFLEGLEHQIQDFGTDSEDSVDYPDYALPVAEAVERYVSLQSEIKELQLRLDELKQMLVSFCQDKELNRVFGSEHALTYRLVERAGFSEDEVRALLEPEGLLDRVLGLDQSKLKQLIGDEAVAEDIRNRLEALKQVVSSYPQLFPKKLAQEE